MSHIQILKISGEDSQQRLDRYLRKKFPHISHILWEKWCRKGNLRLNGKRVKPHVLLKQGDCIRIPPLPPALPSFEKGPASYIITKKDQETLKQMLIYEDDSLIVLNKPAGLAVQGGTRTKRHIDGLSLFFQKDGLEKPRLVHRLDRDTSGLLVLAKTLASARFLTQAFKEKRIQKFYSALVTGIPFPSTQTITLPLAKGSGIHKEKIGVTPQGKETLTHLEVLKTSSQGYALVKLCPETGRTHQLRVHCQALGHPIVGDGKYGGKGPHPFKRSVSLQLHAYALTIPCPQGGEDLYFQAPPPPDFTTLMEILGMGFWPPEPL